MKSYERIERNWPFFGQNGQILVKKGPKKGQKDFCQNFHWVIIVKDHKYNFNIKTIAKSYEQIGINWQKLQFLGQNGNLFGQKWVENDQKLFFAELLLSNYSKRPQI